MEGSEAPAYNISDQERDKVWFSGYLELGPGESKEITFKYYLPSDAINNNYKLTIQKQSGIDKEKHTVNYNGQIKEIELIKDTTVEMKVK